jgi:predicted alpha/beta-fold hydrolase
MRDLKTMTAELVREHTDFATLEEYLNGYAVTGARLAQLEVPATIFTSLDDPIIPAEALSRLARPAALSLSVSRYGGHCGFFARLAGPTWLERRIVRHLGGAPL